MEIKSTYGFTQPPVWVPGRGLLVIVEFRVSLWVPEVLKEKVSGSTIG